jgi:hypothetical protein
MDSPLKLDVYRAVKDRVSAGDVVSALVVLDVINGHVGYVIDGECMSEDRAAAIYLESASRV